MKTEIRFALRQNGEWMLSDEGVVHLFTPEEARDMLADDRIPLHWWTTRKFEKYPSKEDSSDHER